MTPDENSTLVRLERDIREVLTATRDNGRRIDGVISRVDDLVVDLGEVKLQAALMSGRVVKLNNQLDDLNTAEWDATAALVSRARSLTVFVRRRGLLALTAVLTGAGGSELLRQLLS